MELKRFNNEHVIMTMTFDNGLTYVASTAYSGDKVITSLNIRESKGSISGNPLGIMSSNSININIFDRSGVLIKTNKNSPYYGYMRNGVKIELQWVSKDGTHNPLGTYYTNSWSNTRIEGGYQAVNISAQDKLNYIGNLKIPELPAFSSIEIKGLLDNIFKAIGLTTDEYIIDENLNLKLTFSITKGARLRDTLNAIAQALIARISINRSGIIEVRPAFIEIPTELDYIDSRNLITGTLRQHQYTDYASVQLSYFELGLQNSIELAHLDNIIVVDGENNFDNLQLSNRVQGIDLVTFDYSVTDEDYNKQLLDIEYIGYQGGISVKIKNDTGIEFNGNIIVDGRETGNSEVVISKDILEADRKVSNTLMLTSDYIQNREDAQAYLDAVVNYINMISNAGTFDKTLIGFDLTTGVYINVNNNDDNIRGVYYVHGINYNLGETFSSSFEVIKMNIEGSV